MKLYSNKNKTPKNVDKFKLLNFESIKNREYVLQWLNNTRNDFIRLTQPLNEDIGSDQDFSVKCKNFTLNMQHKTLDDSISCVPNNTNCRSKSLDFNYNKRVTKKNRDCRSEVPDDCNIDDINTEEENLVKKAEESVLLNFIEDELLDKLHMEFEKPKVSKGTRNKSEKHMVSLNAIISSSSNGWDRLTKIKKGIKTSPKKPKELKIIVKRLNGGYKESLITKSEQSNNGVVGLFPTNDMVSFY